MARITVLGAGVMGTALTFPLSDNGHEVRLVGTHLDDEIIRSCKEARLHPKLRRQIPDRVTPYAYSEAEQALPDAEVILLGVNSRGVHWAAEVLGRLARPGQIIMMVTKGLESVDGELKILPDVLYARLPAPLRDQLKYAAIGGPSIAGELAARHHTSVVFVSRDESILPYLQSLYATPYYHIWTSTDMLGVELCVALKNPVALAVGLAAGVLEKKTRAQGPDPVDTRMFNFAAGVFAQGLTEMAYIVQLLGGRPETIYSLPGAGDLFVTSMGGRNQRMGRLLGMGMPFSEAVEEMPGETIEGVDATIAIMPAIDAMTQAGKIDADALPMLRTLYRILTRNAPAEFEFDRFFASLPMFTPPPARSAE